MVQFFSAHPEFLTYIFTGSIFLYTFGRCRNIISSTLTSVVFYFIADFIIPISLHFLGTEITMLIEAFLIFSYLYDFLRYRGILRRERWYVKELN